VDLLSVQQVNGELTCYFSVDLIQVDLLSVQQVNGELTCYFSVDLIQVDLLSIQQVNGELASLSYSTLVGAYSQNITV
jgi:hypothetical protein